MTTHDFEERRQRMRREADGIAERRDDVIGSSPPLAKLVDCEVCAGTGVMTARPAGAAEALPALIPCPACCGQGAMIAGRRPHLLAVPDA